MKKGASPGFFRKNRTILMERTRESLSSVLPVTLVMLVLCFTIAPVSSGVLLSFLSGAVLLVLGMGLFTLGSEMSMTPMGEHVGASLTRSRKLLPALLTCLIVGVIITISEPDLQVLANQVPIIPNPVLIGAVAAGVGVFMAVALLRILFKIRIRYLLIGFYALIFLLTRFVSPDFWAVAFDSGGVTTGPMTVPFIMALGVGISSIRADRQAANDSFGLVALCSIGPILAVFLLGMVYQSDGVNYSAIVISEVSDSRALINLFLTNFPHYFKEVAIAMLPIALYFILAQIFALKLVKRQLIRILVGFVYTYLGLSLFLTGVNVGFMPAGNALGELIGALPYRWILIPIGMLVGYFIVEAEPAVYVLNRQVHELTSGAISQRAMKASLSIGVSVSVGLAMLRILTGISILWFLAGGYLLALVLTFFVPDLFTSIAFDSGGVASGPMTATFLLPFAMGACQAMGGNLVTDAFGIVAMVAMTPLITIQILGVIYVRRLKKAKARGAQAPLRLAAPEQEELTGEIIDV